MSKGVRRKVLPNGGKYALGHDDEALCWQKFCASRRQTGVSSGQNGEIRVSKNGGGDQENDCGQGGRDSPIELRT